MLLAYQNDTSTTPIFEKVIKACSLKDRMIGLLKHSHLEKHEALWIVPCNSIQTFFMRFTIDVAFLNKDLNVVRVYQKLKPFRLTPIIFNASSVLEMPKGSIDKYNLSVGDTLIFKEPVP